MSAVANIVLNDAQATPVAHTFVPIGPDLKGVWWWEDQSASESIGYNRISMQLKRVGNPAPGSNSGGRVNRVLVSIHCPVLETLATNDAGLTPPPTVAYVSRANVEFILPERNSLQDRKTLRKFVDFLAAETQLTGMVETLQNVY
jgi:hypothetical protein